MTDISTKVKYIIAECTDCAPDQIQEAMSLGKDLNIDSLDAADLILAISEEFSIDIPDDAIAHIYTVKDLIKAVEERL